MSAPLGFDLESLKQLREIGAKHVAYEDQNWRVEFFEPLPEVALGAITPQAVQTQNAPFQEDKCSCGHEAHAHEANGLCLLGCKVEACARGRATP